MVKRRKDERLVEEDINEFGGILTIIHNYFPKIFELMNQIQDPRNQSYITYKQSDLVIARMLGSMCDCSSMNQMNRDFNNTNVIENYKILCGNHISELPHGDTINNYLKEVCIDALRGLLKLLKYMFKSMIDKKLLEDYRINNKYYQIIIDATQLFSFHEEHVENCLIRKHKDGVIDYYSNVLVAIVTMGNIVIPIDFELIDNEAINTSKQDCETNAAKRLLARIKRDYKRLPICLCGDGLYFNEPILNICKNNNWKYIITYKEGCASSIEEYYQVAKSHGDIKTYDNDGNHYEYYNGIEYHGHIVNMMRMKTKENDKEIEFCYTTNFDLD